MRLKQLESMLTEVKVFEQPKHHLEQYPTSAHLAARIVYTAHSVYDDIEGKVVADLGIGCGILTIASVMLGSAYNIGVDVDEDAVAVAQDNLAAFDMDDPSDDGTVVDIVLSDVESLNTARIRADTVLMNPPFGTKNAGIDMVFLRKATEMANVVYSLHKTSTRDHIVRKATEWGFDCEVVADMKFDIPNMYKFHKKRSVDVEVDLLRLSRRRS
ncbi:hypothetical protein RI367_002242 [Sorochytrium milnesiophthora]